MNSNTITNSRFFKDFLLRATKLLGKKNKMIGVCHEVLKKLGDGKSLSAVGVDAIKQLKVLVDLVQCFVKGTYTGVSKKSIIVVIAALLYFVSPIDVVPDFIPILGWADDFTLISWVFSTLSKELEAFDKWRGQFEAA